MFPLFYFVFQHKLICQLLVFFFLVTVYTIQYLFIGYDTGVILLIFML